MLSKIALIAATLAFVSPIAAAAASASGDVSSPAPALSIDGAKAARLLARASRKTHPIYGAPASRQDAAAGGDSDCAMAGGAPAYEFSAHVEGRVSSGGEDMLMLQVEGSNRLSGLDAIVPHSFYAPWIDSGSQVRLIVRPIASELSAGDLDSRADCAIVAAAPDAEMLLLEHPGLAAGTARRGVAHRQPTISRSAAYARSPIIATASTSSPLALGHPICNLSPGALAAFPAYRGQIHRINRQLDGATLDRITSSILSYSDYYRIDPRLIVAMIIAESHFDPNSVSRSGAIGLGQLMPSTAAGMGVDPWDLERSIGASVKILSAHVAQYGGADEQGLVPLNTLLLTMAAYNAGGGAVRRYHGIPPYRETQAYVRKVASYYRQLCGT